MKAIYLLILLSSALTGCATYAPKEDLHDIFTLVKQRNFDAAKDKVKSTENKGMLGQYSGFDGTILDPENQLRTQDNVRALIDGAQYTITFCDEKVTEAKGTHTDNLSGDENQRYNFQQGTQKTRDEFEQECVKKPQEQWSSIQKIKRYASVDLFPLFKADKIQFDKEVARINSGVAARNTQLAEASAERQVSEEKYEQSPEFYSKKLCEMQSIVTAAKSNIAEEKKAAEYSGMVDKVKMYENGRAIQINNDRIKKFSAEYKSKFGKNWSPSVCR